MASDKSFGGESSYFVRARFSVPDRKVGEKLLTVLRNRFSDMLETAKIEEVVTGGYAGKSIIQRLEVQMDKRRKTMEKRVIQVGSDAPKDLEYVVNKGRYEGIAAALAIMRSSSVAHEIEQSNGRLGIES
jgi:hypothetical protein